jgi:hypothetical protein
MQDDNNQTGVPGQNPEPVQPTDQPTPGGFPGGDVPTQPTTPVGDAGVGAPTPGSETPGSETPGSETPGSETPEQPVDSVSTPQEGVTQDPSAPQDPNNQGNPTQ